MTFDHPIIAVDPGKTGALVFLCPGQESERPTVHRFAKGTPQDVAGICRNLASTATTTLPHTFIEKVHSSPSMGGKHGFSFGENFGTYLGIFYALQFQITLVPPQEWQRSIPGVKGTVERDRKNALKAQAQRLFPDRKVTLDDADALLIYDYAIRVEHGKRRAS